MKRGTRSGAALILMMVLTCACVRAEAISADVFAMDTHIRISLYDGEGEEVKEAAKALILRYEQMWSVTNTESEIYGINCSAGETIQVSDETVALIRYALQMAESTGGTFDPTVYPLVRAWGFTTDEYRIPGDEELDALTENVDYRRVMLEGNQVTLPEGMQLDMGAIAKGWICDEVVELLKEQGVTSALIDFGGNIYALGGKTDGSDWRIGLEAPDGEGYYGILHVQNRSVVTSSAQERYFTGEDGRVYGHIIDPKTGYPAESGLVCVTIVGEISRICDALSTAIYVMGAEAGCEYWRQTDGFDMLMLAEDGTLYVTEGLEDCFSLTEDSGIKEMHVVRK